jgi:TolQ protein
MEPSLVPPAIVMNAPEHLSTIGMFLKADPVVKAIVVLLVLASVGVWAIILDKAVRMRGLRRQAAGFQAQADGKAAETETAGLAADTLAAGYDEARDAEDPVGESRAERRERIERAMRAVVGTELRRLERGLPFLATIGSAAPFIGLFGTVWGIMNSFQAIARSQDTSLAVVAPGIAEALFATAIGLAAAIPAVMAYNKISSDLSDIAYRFSAGIGVLGAKLARGSAARKKAAE